MDPLRFAIAAIPLAAYLLTIAVACTRQRPTLVSGPCDQAVLGLGLTGIAFVGPMEQFRPESSTMQFGNGIWLFLLALYWLGVVLLAMVARPRLVVYNATPDQVRPLLAEVARQVDLDSRWAGDCLLLGKIGVQLHCEGSAWWKCVSLVSSGPRQEVAGWRHLQRLLRRELGQVTSSPHHFAWALALLGLLLAGGAVTWLWSDWPAAVEAYHEIVAYSHVSVGSVASR